uniref:Mitogen-activated protein kinase kinase kinase n=1 Tax=Tetraselmis sp. GSL018 TaxID=582737 RepID=A0A061REG8_9CHLO
MLVDAVRSKDDARLQEVIGQLRGFNARDERVKGIDDRHAVTGRTALHEAVMLNRLTSVQVLLRAGADPNVGHSTQGPPLLHAAAWGETALVDALVLCGSGIDASDCAEYTALHYAVVGDHLDTAQILIGHGADTRRCNDEGRTPSELATSAAMVELLTQAESRRERPRSAGPHRATPQEVEEALERLRTAAAEVLPQSPQLSETSGSPMSRMSPGGTQNPSRRSCEGPQPGVMLEDLVGHMERDASGTQPSKPPCGEALATKDPDTPPLLRDVSPPRSPSCQPTTPTATSQPKLPLTCRSDGQGEQATGWSPLPRLSYAGTASEHGSRPASGSRPGTGIFDPSGRPNNPRAAEAAARAAAAVGTPVTGLNQRAAQMFYQSIEVQTGDIVWTQGELLGEGAYGKVYAGLNQHTGELMAVKVLPLNMGSGASDENKLHLQALERELGMYRKFQHRHIVGYLAAHMDFKTNTMYMFLEYVPGGSISSMLQRFGAFSEELTRKFTRELLMGLEYLHGCKVIHRDLKGGNVLVTKSGRVKLADFGASKAYHEATITDGMKSIRGSVYWMAPEVIKGTGYGRRADIWSVGCTVLEMLTATHPWPDLDNHWSAMFHIAKAKSGPPIPKNVSGLCREFLESCLQVEAHRRPTATELLQHPFVCQIPNALREAEMARGLNHSL